MSRPAHNLHSPFGADRFGQVAERFARFFGTPRFILRRPADPPGPDPAGRPRQAAAEDMSRIADVQRRHVEQQTGHLQQLLEANTALTQRIAAMTSELHAGASAEPSGDDDG